jgi:hypothetical protein
MADERHQRLMQEALDERLSAEAMQQFREQLALDEDTLVEFDRLLRVDRLLSSAPVERAPARLALSIMAQIARGVQTEQPMTTASSLAVALGLSLVIIVTLPVLVAAVTLFLTAAGSAAALAAIIQAIAHLMAIVVAILEILVQGAQSVLATYPQAPLLLISVTPIIAFWLLRVVQNDQVEGTV